MVRSDMSPAARRARASYAAHVSHRGGDGLRRTAAARLTFAQRFAELVDPTGSLTEAERQRRGERLRAAWFAYIRLHAAMGTKAGRMDDWLRKQGIAPLPKARER